MAWKRLSLLQHKAMCKKIIHNMTRVVWSNMVLILLLIVCQSSFKGMNLFNQAMPVKVKV